MEYLKSAARVAYNRLGSNML